MKSSLFLNPIVAYVLTWMITLLLHYIGLTKNLFDINFSTAFLIFSNVTTFLILGMLFLFKERQNEEDSEVFGIHYVLNLSKKILLIWFIGSLVEIVYSGGLPITGEIVYVDFGVSTFHGLMNAFYYMGICGIWIRIVYLKRKKYIILILLLLTWPILIVSRNLLISAFLEILAIYLYFNKIKVFSIIKIIFVVISVIFVFGEVGEIRSGDGILEHLLKEEYQWIFEYSPSGFLWVYIYITGPINNVIYNINSIIPLGYPYYSIYQLLPSFIRKDFFSSKYQSGFDFIDGFNVNTFYFGYLIDYGIWGTVASIVILQVVILKIYCLSKKNIGYLISYAALYQSLILSIFIDFFTSLVFLIQVFFGIYLGIKIDKIRKRRKL